MPLIIWSDDCLSCLAGLPHSFKAHTQAVNDAFEELRQENEDLARLIGDVGEDDSPPDQQCWVSNQPDQQCWVSNQPDQQCWVSNQGDDE